MTTQDLIAHIADHIGIPEGRPIARMQIDLEPGLLTKVRIERAVADEDTEPMFLPLLKKTYIIKEVISGS